jgi:hypothetical protein
MVYKEREIIIAGRRFPHGTKSEIGQDNTINSLNTHDGKLKDEEEQDFSFSIELAKTEKISPREIWDTLKNRPGGYEAVLRDDDATYIFSGVFCSNLKAVFDAGVRTTIPLEFEAENMVVQ